MKIISPNVEQYPSVDKISDSYDTLKEGVGELAGQVKSDAAVAAGRLSTRTTDFLKEKYDGLRSEMSSDLGKMKSYVQEQPAKGMAIAFVAGAFASALMRRG